MTKAYSYIRFSTAKQQSGDSLRRQEKLATEYAARHSLDLDNSSYRDLGMSAYRGKNASEGSLKLFLDAVDQALIAKGSYLLVESLDRLSRAEVPDALELLLGIIRRGIVVVSRLVRALSRDDAPFQLHIAVYPGCQVFPQNVKPAGGTVRFLLGAKDNYTGISGCVEIADKLKAAGVNSETIVYPGAYHGWDEAVQAYKVDDLSSANCRW